MIGMSDDDVSNYYMDITIPSWEDVGISVMLYDAITPKTLSEYNYLTFEYNKSYKYISENIKKDITATERACFYSHVEILKMIEKKDQEFIILEHDALLVDPDELFRVFKTRHRYDLMYFGQAIESYWMSKSAISKYLRKLKHDVVDAGPMGMIEYILNRPKAYKRWKYPTQITKQVYNPNIGQTINHYEGQEELANRYKDLDAESKDKMLWITEQY